MSALTDLFTALANKIRSKTGGSTTYTPPQMVNAIDDVYQAGVDAGETTHTRTYTPAANTAANDMGVTHDYRYVNTSGMIVPSGAKSITANGTGIDVSNYATANVNVPNPTLSGDATAADVKSGKTFYGSSYTKQTGTYVEPTINSITPSNTSPASMSANSNYKPSSSGYAISSYDSVTPSSSGTYFSSGMKKMASSGYAYASPVNVKVGTITATGANTYTVELGFKPKYIAVAQSNAAAYMCIYDERYNTSGCMYAGTGTYSKYVAFTSSTSGVVKSITNTGFTYSAQSGSRTYNYFAIG